MSITNSDLISSALRLIGAIAPGEAMTDTEVQDGLLAMNLMLDNWANKRLIFPMLSKENFPLAVNVESYTIGPAGTFDTSRPNDINDAFIRDSNNFDYPMDIITEEEYNGYPDKKIVSDIPAKIFYDPQFPLGVIYLYPKPAAAYTLFIETRKPFVDVTALSDAPTFQSAYFRAIKYNLAIELAPEYGADVPKEVIAMAADSYRTLQQMNAVEVAASFDFRSTRRFNIRSFEQ